MKHNATLLLLIATIFLHTNAQAYSQGITLKVSDVTLDKVFSLLQKQTKFVFVYSAKQLAGTKRVSVDVTNEKFEKVMQMVMDGQPLRYELDKEYVIIKVKMPNVSESLSGRPGELTGRVTNEKGEPVAGATVTVKNSNINAATDPDGYFTLKGVDTKAELVITSIGYEPKIVKLTGEEKITIRMIVSAQTIKEVIVKGNTGYQVIDKEHPGSFDVVDNELLNRRVSRDVLARIENLTTGLSFNNAQDGVLIRGRNSIYSNVSPLIILDNFPYDGDIKNINPNDIESITILKDASAAAQWGARAGNGVIVITSKKGKTNKPLININTNVSFQPRPNLDKLPLISSAEEIEVEKWLFDNNYYNATILNTRTYPVLSPVQEILLRRRNGEIDASEADRQIEELKKIDVKDDLERYFYQPSIAEQYALNVSGSSQKISYYLSAGYDKQRMSIVGNESNRISLKSQNSFRINEFFSIDAGILYTQSNITTGRNPGININSGNGKGLYPYADLVDKAGNAVKIVKDFRNSYKDTAGNGKLLDWQYRPYDEIYKSTNKVRGRDFLINVGAQYKVLASLQVDIKYQFQNVLSLTTNSQSQDAYDVRNMINTYYQPNAENKYPVPLGGILDLGNQEIISHQGRIQLTYNQNWGANHKLSAFGGWEIKKLQTIASTNRIYGYQEEGSSVVSTMDFVTYFPQYYWSALTAPIPNSLDISTLTDRFVSYYFNGLYSYKERYTFSTSMRKDEANLFGASTNQKGTPLWSIGFGWDISKEWFYNSRAIPELRARISYGHSGNFSRNATGVTTMERNPGASFLGNPYATITNFPNKTLRWEQNRILNVGIDFQTKNRRISGTLEYYRKHNKDLMAQSPIDPTTGLTPINGGRAYYFGNVASVKGHGYEFNLKALLVDRKLKWNSSMLFTYVQMKVSEYLIPASKRSSDYVRAEGTILPVIGKPVYNFYAYAWGGLDSEFGDPQGYLGKDKSKKYLEIMQNTTIDSLIYKGNAQSPMYGAWLNTLTWRNFSISANISFRLKYFVRRPVLTYSGLYSSWTGSSDYSKRWQKTGDELSTNVPSQVYITYPDFLNRQQFYISSEVPIVKADQIRIEDVSFSYSIAKKNKKLPFDQLRIYGYLNNLNAILWKANKEGVDPNSPAGNIQRLNMSIGLSANF